MGLEHHLIIFSTLGGCVGRLEIERYHEIDAFNDGQKLLVESDILVKKYIQNLEI